MFDAQKLSSVPHGRTFHGTTAGPAVAGPPLANRCDKFQGGKRRKGSAGGDTTAIRTDKAVKAFNTWAFKREQPSCPGLLSGVVNRAVADGRPIPFVLYWGKGPRTGLDRPDLTCLDYLKSMADRVAEAHAAGAAIHLILTDTHAELNGHPAAAVDSYFDAIDAAARQRGFTTTRLSTVVASASGVADIASAEVPSGDVLESLVACAAKWYRGEGSSEEGAREYYRMNMIEKRAIEIAFPDAVFVTFNGGEFRDLFPDGMPIFYMYSLRRGVGVKPWFMSSDSGAERGSDAGRSSAPKAPSTRTAQ